MSITFQIKKKLGDFQLDVNFSSDSNRIGILGASGSGKSMILKSIAGIEKPDEGKIVLGSYVKYDSKAGVNVKPQVRNIGYMFQNYALFPTWNVYHNIEAGLEKRSKPERQKRVAEMIKKFQLQGLEEHLPGQLSGGQQQRVALARIMAFEPEAILLDEPFSALDVFLKDRLQQEMVEMLADYKGTVILVSHSRDEIFRFSEELLIVENGRTVTCGKTPELFEMPRYEAAARLTGCKNIAKIYRVNPFRAEVPEWGMILETQKEIPSDAEYIGYRAHDFVPVWGYRRVNCLSFNMESAAMLPFETNYYINPSIEVAERICWIVPRENAAEMGAKGMPQWLHMKEEKIMFLKK